MLKFLSPSEISFIYVFGGGGLKQVFITVKETHL